VSPLLDRDGQRPSASARAMYRQNIVSHSRAHSATKIIFYAYFLYEEYNAGFQDRGHDGHGDVNTSRVRVSRSIVSSGA